MTTSKSKTSHLLPLREKVPEGRMRGSFRRLIASGSNPSSVSAFGRSASSLRES
jgi:hypothetical protein